MSRHHVLRKIGLVALIALGLGLTAWGQGAAELQAQLDETIARVVELRAELRALERDVAAAEGEELLSLEERNLALGQRLVEISAQLFDAEDGFIAEVRSDLWAAAMVPTATRESLRAGLLLLSVEEAIAMAKSELAAAWLESSLVEQQLDREKKKLLLATLENDPPQACFAYQPGEPTVADVVEFTDCSADVDGEVVSWDWEFGDGASSQEQSPVHAYAAPGTYTVTLRVTDDHRATDYTQEQLTVQNTPPTACFSFQPPAPTTQGPVRFADCSTDVDGEIVCWSWEFGDGFTSSLPDPVHRYAKGGTYTVTLRVTDDRGAADATRAEVVVANMPPTACFTFAPVSPATEQEVSFDDCSMDVDGDVVSWTWDLGDGTTSALQDPTHRYAKPGSYTVRLEVADDQGATDWTEQKVTVRATLGALRVVPGGSLAEAIGDVPKSILILFDASGSMREPFEGTTKIDVAREVLTDLIQIMPEDVRVGLRSFSGCGQSQLLVPVKLLDRAALIDQIRAIEPGGLTPLAYTIKQAPKDFIGTPKPWLVILVSDGKETCLGDPVAEAQDLTAKGYELRFQVVGYDVEREAGAREQLEAIAAATGGAYFRAETGEELKTALRLAAPIVFHVYDAAGDEVFTGLLGSTVPDMEPGTYRVAFETPVPFEIQAIVRGSETTTVALEYVDGEFSAHQR
ncbi:MAG: PKD domain-containing protein [Candidatus Bipolaricaulaceae bacterium]